jgi:hypothetical protein
MGHRLAVDLGLAAKHDSQHMQHIFGFGVAADQP